jgi:hypothetical protein
MSRPEQSITFPTAIIIVLVGLYLLGGLFFLVYMTWNDARRRRIIGTWLDIGWMFTGGIGVVLCLLAWPLLWLLFAHRCPGPQPPKHIESEK